MASRIFRCHFHSAMLECKHSRGLVQSGSVLRSDSDPQIINFFHRYKILSFIKTMQIQNQNLAKRFLINVALIILSITLLGCASRQTEIIIPASPDKIWAVLIDTDGYKEWNPVFVPLKGRLEQVEEGEILTWLYTQRGQDPIETEMKVVKFVEHKQLNQQGGIWGILNVNHNWFLDPVPEGTRVTNREEWSGIGVLFWDYSWVEPTYKEMNENLKKQVLRTR